MSSPHLLWPSLVRAFEEEVDYAVEGIEAEGPGDRSAKVGVGVDVVKDAAAVEGFEIFDAADVEATCGHQLPAGFDGFGGDLFIRIEFDRLGGGVAVPGLAIGGIADLRGAEVEGSVRDDAHGVEQFTAEKFHANDTAGR